MTWLQHQRFEDETSQYTFDSYLLAIEQLQERQLQIESRLAHCAAQEPYREPVSWLRCFRGIDTFTAISLVAELHDFRRFRSARELTAYLGLIPSERTSGMNERRGSITKAGNRHARRLLVEAAWHNRHRPALSQPLQRRRQDQPVRIIAIADRAQERLYRRWWRMTSRGVPSPKVVVAMARELAGYVWATLHPQAGTTRTA